MNLPTFPDAGLSISVNAWFSEAHGMSSCPICTGNGETAVGTYYTIPLR